MDALELDVRLAELTPVARVTAGKVEGACGDAERLGRNHRTGMGEDAHRELEPFPFLAEPVSRRHREVFEKQLRRRRSADAELLLQLANFEPGHPLLHDEGGDVARRRIAIVVS